MLPSLVQTHIVHELKLMSRCRFNSESLNTKFTETFANVGRTHSFKGLCKVHLPVREFADGGGAEEEGVGLTCFDKNETPGTLVREVPLTWERPCWGVPRSPARCDSWGLRGTSREVEETKKCLTKNETKQDCVLLAARSRV